MRKTVYIFVLLFVSISGFAQTNKTKIGLFEFEIGGDMIIGNKCEYLSIKPGFEFNLEGRFNLNSSPFDVGLQFALGQFYRTDDVNSYGVRYFPSMIFACDYNFRISKVIAPYGGLGIGLSRSSYDVLEYSEWTGEDIISQVPDTRFVIYPRIGIELIEHIRVNMGYKCYLDKYHNTFLFGIGFVFGGGSKKP